MYIKCDDWQDLPVGFWLVKVKTKAIRQNKDIHMYHQDPTRNYHTAKCVMNDNSRKIIIVGGRFSFDMGDIISYTEIPMDEHDANE